MLVKRDLRERLRKIVSEIPPEAAQAKSAQACELLCAQPEFLNAQILMVFLALPSELDTTQIVLRAWQDNKRVLAPRASWSQRRMMAIEIRSLTTDLQVSEFGMREPASGVPIPPAIIDLVVVPGLGFDEYGNRLGRGRGFYDRFLAHPEFAGTACALAFEEQVCPTIPAGPLDRCVNMLVTDAKVRRF